MRSHLIVGVFGPISGHGLLEWVHVFPSVETLSYEESGRSPLVLTDPEVGAARRE